MSSTRDAKVVAAYRSGRSVRQSAAAGACSPSTAQRILHAAGVAMRPPGPRPHGRRVDFTRQQIAGLATRYLAREGSLHDLGAPHGMSGEMLARRLRAAGVLIHPKGATLAAARRPRRPRPAPRQPRALPSAARLVSDYTALGTLRALSRRHRISEYRLKAALERAGISTARIHPVTPRQRQQIEQLAAAGMPYGDICRRTSVSMPTVRRITRPPKGSTRAA